MTRQHQTMPASGADDRSRKAAAVALGMVTVGFAAGLYVPAEAQVEFYTPYFNQDVSMYYCVCEQTEQVCAPCS